MACTRPYLSHGKPAATSSAETASNCEKTMPLIHVHCCCLVAEHRSKISNESNGEQSASASESDHAEADDDDADSAAPVSDQRHPHPPADHMIQ